MLILAIIVALVIDAVALLAAFALFRRTESTIVRVLTALSALFAVITSAGLASLATVGVQTRVVMYAMARQEPTATILATDREMRGKLRAAVRSGLEMDGSKADNVRGTVTAVLKPYMAYRLSHARDRDVIASARATAAMLGRAKTEGATTCNAVLAGDVDVLRRLTTPETSAWLGDMLRGEALDRVDAATQPQMRTFVASLAAARRWTMQDVAAAASRSGPLACDYPIAVIDAATQMPERDGAAMLRGLGFGGQAVTVRNSS